MNPIHPAVEEAVETLPLSPLTRRRLLHGTGPGQRLARRVGADRRLHRRTGSPPPARSATSRRRRRGSSSSSAT